MLSFFSRLFGSVSPKVALRASITPGRLYALMSTEFKAMRPLECGSSCIMPLPCMRERTTPDACNWSVQRLTSGCERCERLAVHIAGRYAALYDVRDPFWLDEPGLEAPRRQPELFEARNNFG